MESFSGTPPWGSPQRLQFRRVSQSWSAEDLLEQTGWFPLAGVMRTLDPDNSGKYRRILALREKLLKSQQDAHALMGIKPFGSRIWAEMPLFSKWYLSSEILQVAKVPRDWDLETFLEQRKGIFTLRGVLNLLPQKGMLKYPSMTQLISNCKDSRSEMGAAKLSDAGYVVYMPQFADWLRSQLD